jgi:hypothetical protein
MKLTGKISVRPFGAGTKSEHDAVYLDTADGNYRLQKKGANPFENTALKQLEGKKVIVEGTLDKAVFFASTIKQDE